jgi:hypothetical protein
LRMSSHRAIELGVLVSKSLELGLPPLGMSA